MRALVVAVVVALALGGCGKSVEQQVSSGGFKVYEAASTRNAQLVAVIDSRSHAVDRTLPWGILAGKHLYSMTTSNTLADFNPETGAATRSVRLPGDFQLANGTVSGIPGGLSQDGHWLVLERASPTSVTGSQLIVIDTSTLKAAAPIDLAGSFEFDAISNDGKRIFLIEHVNAGDYRVRLYDAASGQLDPNVVVDKSEGATVMAGIRLSGIPSPDGQWLYSVYARPRSGAFIHALNLTGAYAFCLDLPGSGYEKSSDEFQWSLAMNADGSKIYAANGARGLVAEVQSDSGGAPTITRTVHVNASSAAVSWFVRDVEAKELATGGVVVSRDGKTLVMSGKTGLVWVDAATLRARSRHLASWTIWSLSLSPDGSTIYALNNAGTIAELSMTNPGTPNTFGASGAQPMALIRIDSPPAP